MKLSILAGATSQTINIFIQDSSSTTGAGLTGLAFNTASLVAYYALPKAAAVQITLATLAAITTAYSSGGFKEVDATNMPGWYRLDLPDAAIASGRFVSLHLKGATNMAPLPIEIELTAWNNQDGVRGGMTALPNAAANAAGGLPISTAGALDMDDLAADVDAIETRVVLALPAFAPQAAGGLITSIAGSLDLDEMNVDIEAIQAAQLTGAQMATAIFQDATASDFTTAGSIGKSIMNGVALGTGLTVNDLTTKTGFALTAAYDPAKTASQAGDAMALTGAERTALTAVVWAFVVTGTTTAVQAMRGFIAAMLGKASGLDTNAPVYRNIADNKNVISATTDANGNRTAVTLDLT